MFSLQCRCFFALQRIGSLTGLLEVIPKSPGGICHQPIIADSTVSPWSPYISPSKVPQENDSQKRFTILACEIKNSLPMSICFGGCISWIVSGGFPVVSMSNRWWSLWLGPLGHGRSKKRRRRLPRPLSVRSNRKWLGRSWSAAESNVAEKHASICMGSNGTCSLW